MLGPLRVPDWEGGLCMWWNGMVTKTLSGSLGEGRRKICLLQGNLWIWQSLLSCYDYCVRMLNRDESDFLCIGSLIRVSSPLPDLFPFSPIFFDLRRALSSFKDIAKQTNTLNGKFTLIGSLLRFRSARVHDINYIVVARRPRSARGFRRLDLLCGTLWYLITKVQKVMHKVAPCLLCSRVLHSFKIVVHSNQRFFCSIRLSN